MAKRNIKNQAAAMEAKRERKERRAYLEPRQKILNTKSPKCRQCVGSILNQHPDTIKEILDTLAELAL